MPMLAGPFARLDELHIGLDAHLRRVHLVMDEMLDVAVGGLLERHLLGSDDVRTRDIIRAEFGRSRHVFGAVGNAACTRPGEVFFAESFCHDWCLVYRSVGGWKFSLPL